MNILSSKCNLQGIKEKYCLQEGQHSCQITPKGAASNNTKLCLVSCAIAFYLVAIRTMLIVHCNQ